jgi:hypothetical protein
MPIPVSGLDRVGLAVAHGHEDTRHGVADRLAHRAEVGRRSERHRGREARLPPQRGDRHRRLLELQVKLAAKAQAAEPAAAPGIAFWQEATQAADLERLAQRRGQLAQRRQAPVGGGGPLSLAVANLRLEADNARAGQRLQDRPETCRGSRWTA